MSKQPQSTKASSTFSKWIAAIPDIIWAPLTGGMLILLVGLVGLVAHQPWLFPSLGPSVFLQTEQPNTPTARFYNTLVGHMLGLSAGFLVVILLGAENTPSVLSSGELTLVRVWTATLAVALNLMLGYLFKASHPPAAATTLLIALGGFKPTLHDGTTIVAGVLVIAIAGEVMRQLRLENFLNRRG